MPNGYLEHANITVSDPERSAALFQKLCGWHERWRGPALNNGRTIHVGTDRDYLAILHPRRSAAASVCQGRSAQPHRAGGGRSVEAELANVEAGLVPFNHADYEPGRRFYFFDWDGTTEVVSYD